MTLSSVFGTQLVLGKLQNIIIFVMPISNRMTLHSLWNMYLLLNKLNWTDFQWENFRRNWFSLSLSLSGIACLHIVNIYLAPFKIIEMSLITCSELGVDGHTGAYYQSSVIGDNRSHWIARGKTKQDKTKTISKMT